MSSKVFSRAVKLIMCCILKRVIQGKERKQALCMFIFKGRGLNSTVLKALNLPSLLNIQLVMSKQLNFSSLEFN